MSQRIVCGVAETNSTESYFLNPIRVVMLPFGQKGNIKVTCMISEPIPAGVWLAASESLTRPAWWIV